MSTQATIQHLRSFVPNQHPSNLEPGQIGFNISGSGSFIYIGNGSNTREDASGTDLSSGLTGTINGKGWVRAPLGGGGTGPSISVGFVPPEVPPATIGDLYIEIRYSSPNRAYIWIGVDPLGVSTSQNGWATNDTPEAEWN